MALNVKGGKKEEILTGRHGYSGDKTVQAVLQRCTHRVLPSLECMLCWQRPGVRDSWPMSFAASSVLELGSPLYPLPNKPANQRLRLTIAEANMETLTAPWHLSHPPLPGCLLFQVVASDTACDR